MTAAIEAYPLTWPIGQARTPRSARRHAAFKVGMATSRDELVRDLARLGARHVVISTNIPLRRDGLPFADYREPDDPGVAVYFERRRGAGPDWSPFVIACDTYTRVWPNMRAIGATVDALRTIQRHGASEMLEQAFTGFAALPAGPVADPPWWEVLGVDRYADDEALRTAYRELARTHHPDAGGSHEVMAAINRAMEAARAGRGAA